MRSDRQELPEGFTKEDADKAEVAEAKLLAASRSRNARSSATNAVAAAAPTDCMVYYPAWQYVVCGAIRIKYDSLGGVNSFLLWPTSNELVNPDQIGRRQTFLNGPIYWHPNAGAHPVVNHFFAAWQRNGWEAGPLGYPTTDEIVNPDGLGLRQEFQNTAAIYWRLNEAYAIRGAIRDKWNMVGAENTGSLLGYPLTDEVVLPDGQGRMNRFERGVLYWSPTTGAHPVTGIILAEWGESGYETGQFGYPVSDERDADPGRVQEFQNGHIDFGTSSDVSQPFYDCQLNVSWPARDSSTYWVGSRVQATCSDPKKRIETVATWFFTPNGGNETATHTYTLSETQPTDNVHSFDNLLIGSCQNGRWRARVVFNITNSDGGVMSDTHRTDPANISGCQSLPPDCPESMSQADCNAAVAAYTYALQHNFATRPNYSGNKPFNDSLGHLPPPVDTYLEYDVYLPDAGGRRPERLVIDSGDPIFGMIWFSKNHFETQEGWTGFRLR